MRPSLSLLAVAALVAPTAAEPTFAAPWDKLDLTAKPEALYKKLGATKPADNVCEQGERVVRGTCLTADSVLGTPIVSLYFATAEKAKKLTGSWGAPRDVSLDDSGRAAVEIWHVKAGKATLVATLSHSPTGRAELSLQPLLPLRSYLPALLKLVGTNRAAVVKALGDHGEQGCKRPDGLCEHEYGPTELGSSRGVVYFSDKDVVNAVTSQVTCYGPCKATVFPRLEKLLGAKRTADCADELVDVTMYAGAPGLVVTSTQNLPEQARICVGSGCMKLCAD